MDTTQAVITLSTTCRGKLHFSRGRGKSLTETLLGQMKEIEDSLPEEEKAVFEDALNTLARHAYSRGDNLWGDICFSHLLRLVMNLDPQRTKKLESVAAILVRQAELTASRVTARSRHHEVVFTDLNSDDSSSSEWIEWGAASTTDVLEVVGTIKINVGANNRRVPLTAFAETLWDACRDPDVAEIIRERCRYGMPTEFEIVPPTTVFCQRMAWPTRWVDMMIWSDWKATNQTHFVFIPNYSRGARGVLLTNQRSLSIPSVVVHSGWIGGGSVMVVNKRALNLG